MVLLAAAVVLSSTHPHVGPGLKAYERSIAVEGKTLKAKVVEAQLSQVRVRVGFGLGRMSRTEALAGIAGRYGAQAAINGTYFEAYTKRTVKNPDQTIVSGGKLLHIGNVGSVIGFGPNGEARIGQVQLAIRGGLDGSEAPSDAWYAYWVNRYPTGGNAVTVFTPEWGPETGLDGLQAAVTDGEVTWVGRYSLKIPKNGFVVYFAGKEEKLAQRFWIGRKIYLRIEQKGSRDPFWDRVQEAIGAGPQLLEHGRVVRFHQNEGFSSPKILSLSGLRSAVGLTEDGRLLLVATSGTLRQTALVMRALGCRDAMNLDGGGSSGLWFEGGYLRKPKRVVANALLLLPPS